MLTQFEREFRTCSLRQPGSELAGNCDLCGERLPRNKDGSIKKNRRWCSQKCSQTVTRNHRWDWARDVALRRDGHKCVKCGASGWGVKLEVNHIVPLVGKGYRAGCSNHLDNLETVCGGAKGTCHVEITKAQREERKNAKP